MNGARGSAEPTASQDEDDRMIRWVLAGDATAYRGLVEKYQSRVHALAYGMIRDREEARDITQETFIRAYQRLMSLQLRAGPLRPWLYRTATNMSIDVIRRRKRRQLDHFADDSASMLEEATSPEVRHVQGPAEEFERQETHDRILDALEEIPEDQRQVLLLRELEGLGYAEIAEIAGVAEGTVMSRLFYARKKLQKILIAGEGPKESGSAIE